MVASHETIRQILKVIRQHVDKETEERILTDLRSISGSESFRDTIVRLCNESDKR